MFANEQAQHLEGYRIYAVAKTHVATTGLRAQGDVTQCTLAALQRRYVALGALENRSIVVVDEI